MATFSATIKRIVVFTSGGDAPGMNAAVRSVVRAACAHKIQVFAAMGGYQGILDNHFQQLSPRMMANIIQRGGTIIKTGRCMDFHKPEGRKQAAENLKNQKFDAAVCIGGDGSFRGAHLLWQEHQFPMVGIPGTIDNDIFGSDRSIGFDTAVNTALSAIDKIRDTAASHDRLFIVEVMGRDSGFIAMAAGLAGGAEIIFTPEYPLTVDKAVERIKAAIANGKTSSILVAAEGQKPGRAYDLAEQIRKKSGLEARVCILGHQQRGGSPTASDRLLASRMGVKAIEVLLAGHCDVMTGSSGDLLVTVPLEQATGQKRVLPKEWIEQALTLAQ